MIEYTDKIDGIYPEKLSGFFIGWPNPPSNKKLLEILKNSTHIWLALDDSTGNVIGFINALSDKVLSSYIPLLEVLPEYQNRGIGKMLAEKMFQTLKNYYMIDLMCDPELQNFYGKLGLANSYGCILRNYERQSGE